MEQVTGGVPSKPTSCPTPLLSWVSSVALPHAPATMMFCPSDSLIAKEPAARTETCRDRETKKFTFLVLNCLSWISPATEI